MVSALGINVRQVFSSSSRSGRCWRASRACWAGRCSACTPVATATSCCSPWPWSSSVVSAASRARSSGASYHRPHRDLRDGILPGRRLLHPVHPGHHHPAGEAGGPAREGEPVTVGGRAPLGGPRPTAPPSRPARARLTGRTAVPGWRWPPCGDRAASAARWRRVARGRRARAGAAGQRLRVHPGPEHVSSTRSRRCPWTSSAATRA